MTHEDLHAENLIPITGEESDQLDVLSLVLSAVDIDHFLDHDSGRLLVASEDVPVALYHLNRYRQENRNWPPPRAPHPTLSAQNQPTLLMMLLLVLFFFHTGQWSPDSNWFTRGAIDNAAILKQGQWWRLITALTLHADLSHLLGNCLIGGPVIHLLGRLIGYGQSRLLLIVSGSIGNLCNIVLRQQPHLSVGFSTAVFAAIGILTGLQLGRASIRSPRAILLPLGAGAGLLAFLGSEGVRTDLGAHLFGFFSGVVCGWLFMRTGLTQRLQRPATQAVQLCLTLTVLLLAWMRALH
jgi:rhomboid protease GluP